MSLRDNSHLVKRRFGTFLVFDIGGTTARAGVIAPDGPSLLRITRASSLHLRDAIDPGMALTTLLREMAQNLDGNSATEIVLAAPGPVVDGVVTKLPTLLGARAVCPDLVAIARAIWPVANIWLCNDLVAAGYGFVAKGHRDFCVLTCGSGIGAKLFLAGRPMLGRRGMGGEIGHWRVPGAPPLTCDCGGVGHLGAVASGRGTLQLIQHLADLDPVNYALSGLAASSPRPETLSTTHIVEQFCASDPWTLNALRSSASSLAAAFSCLHIATGIEQFFITGGFAGAMGGGYATLIAQLAAEASWDTGIDWMDAIQIADPSTEWGLEGGVPYASDNEPDSSAPRSSLCG